MKRFVVRFFFWLSVVLLVLTAFLWWVSHEVAVTAFWTPNTTRYEVFSFNGSLVFCTHGGWVWKEAGALRLTRADDFPDPGGIDQWIGFRAHVHRELLGFEITSGRYLSPFRPAPPDYDGPPNTMLRITTDFCLVIVPYWQILCLTALIPMLSVLRRVKKTYWPSCRSMGGQSHGPTALGR